jgi:hypothetical protein
MKPMKQDDALLKAREALAELGKLDTVRELREEAKQQEAEEASLFTGMKQKFAQARQASKIFNAAAKAVETTMEYARPVISVGKTLGGWLKSAFMFAAFERDGEGDFARDADGDMIFSPRRLGRNLVLGTMIGAGTIVGAQYGYYNATQFEQTIYTSGKDAIISGELYEVSGCTSLPCSTALDNTEFFRIQQSYYAPRLLYPENDVYAVIPKDQGVCQVEGYGLYIKELKWLHKAFEFYPNLTSATCRPYTQAEIEKSIETGVILGRNALDLKPVIQEPVIPGP